MLMVVYRDETTVAYMCGKWCVTASIEVIHLPNGHHPHIRKGWFDHRGKVHFI